LHDRTAKTKTKLKRNKDPMYDHNRNQTTPPFTFQDVLENFQCRWPHSIATTFLLLVNQQPLYKCTLAATAYGCVTPKNKNQKQYGFTQETLDRLFVQAVRTKLTPFNKARLFGRDDERQGLDHDHDQDQNDDAQRQGLDHDQKQDQDQKQDDDADHPSNTLVVHVRLGDVLYKSNMPSIMC
jgi:hypothetical protein